MPSPFDTGQELSWRPPARRPRAPPGGRRSPLAANDTGLTLPAELELAAWTEAQALPAQPGWGDFAQILLGAKVDE